MIYDTIIIGGGPAGLASALYLLRDGRKVLIIEKETVGGTASSTPLIENYPGFKAISGSDLTSAMFDQVDELGVDFEIEEVTDIKVDGDIKEVITEDNTYKAKTIIMVIRITTIESICLSFSLSFQSYTISFKLAI